MSSVTRRKNAAAPSPSKGRDSSGPPARQGSRKAPGPRPSSIAAESPPLPVTISIAIGFMSTNILLSSLLRLGPQYLEPVYGNILPYAGYIHAVVLSFVLGGIMGSSYWRYILSAMDPKVKPKHDPLTVDTKTSRAISMAFDIIGMFTALAPMRATYLFRWSEWLGPTWGPLIIHSTFTLPAFVVSGFITVISAARISYNPQAPLRQSAMTLAYLGAVAMSVWVGQLFAKPHGACLGILINAAFASLSSLIIKLLSGYQENVDAADALSAIMAEKESNEHDSGTASDSNQEPHESSDSSTSEAAVRLAKLRDHQLRKLRFLPVIACLFFVITTYFGEPRCTNGLTAKNNQDTSKYRMLSRTESVTGWITVSDEAKRDLRLLRSGHSIIGGHWNSTTESIFGIFYYPDAVRLIKGRASNPNAKRTGKGKRSRLAKNALIGDGSERALQIGLGIGVSARSLHEQNVRVDVAEIDPAVHQAAVDFFLLPKNLNGVYLEDGRQFIDKAPAHTYDYIVHDVFTGGSVPSSLFSQSAVAQLHRILKPDGVLAMNYVGIPADTRTLYHVLHTLRTSFAHVRCFAESTKDLNTMTNMMFFASDEPIEFDIAPEVLSAMGPESIRARMLADMEKNEISLDGYKPEEARAITDEWNPLTEWQFDTAIQHWKAMREMFPSEYWLNY